MSEQWYEMIKDEKYCSDTLEIFYYLHDYIITKIDIDYQSSTMVVYFRYDTDDEGAALKFFGVSQLNICPLKEYESPWLNGVMIILTDQGDFLCYADDMKYSVEDVLARTDINWIKAREIHFSWLDKNNNSVPFPEEKLNPTWSVMNWDTGEYENVEKHFKVYKV